MYETSACANLAQSIHKHGHCIVYIDIYEKQRMGHILKIEFLAIWAYLK